MQQELLNLCEEASIPDIDGYTVSSYNKTGDLHIINNKTRKLYKFKNAVPREYDQIERWANLARQKKSSKLWGRGWQIINKLEKDE